MPTRPWQLAVAPLLTLVASVLDDPASNTWSGGPVFLASMGAALGMSSRELFLLDRGYSRTRWPLAIASGLLAVFYLGRLAAFLLGGQHGDLFTVFFGTSVTTLITMVLLIVVSFSMAALSTEQRGRDLKARASRSSAELAHAAQVQRNLLPPTSPEVPGYEVAGALVPSRGVSGDFFDWRATEDGLAFTVADVMGKGSARR
ncbi:PP2C family protein-serine/threonine phosphatase [Naasia aerilata]|uniref:Uncharacterized protein n=1 Tax=Naasia aerilata TaxID=1162966 RepID=A0ABN6XIW2_9MICO|nr:hypothetical protein [Naasia aerilata]BDZ44830.1 hypothetical protein GCM10025866_07390 [Naasia aerilata]